MNDKLNSKQTEYAILYFFLFVFVLYGFLLTFGSHSGFPTAMQTGHRMPYLADKPVSEDAYYMLAVAWNLSEGKGFVYNSNKTTTGIQPLGTILYAGIASIVKLLGGDKWAFARFVLILGVFFQILFAHFVGKIAYGFFQNTDPTRHSAYILAVFAAVFNFSLFRIFTYGLETGIYLTLIALCIRETLKYTTAINWTISRAVHFGFLVGLATLARIDFCIIVLFFTCFYLFRRRIRFNQALAAGATALLVVSPWFLWVKSVSGQWLPSSGSAQASLITANNAAQRVLSMVTSFLDHMTPWAFEANRKVLILAGSISLVLFLLWLQKTRKFASVFRAQIEKKTLLIMWAAGMCLLAIIYVVFFWAQHFYGRYSVFVVIIIISVLSTLTAMRIKSMSRWLRLAVFSILPFCYFAAAYFSLHTGRIGNSLTIAAGFIHKEFPQAVKVGSFQSGVIGYFNSNVINLDGKVNSDAMAFLKRGDISKYIDREKIDFLVDWPGYIFKYLEADYLEENWRLYEKTVLEGVILCYIRK